MLYLDLTSCVWSKSVNSGGTGGCFLKTKYSYKDKEYYIKLSDYDTVVGVKGHESINEVIAYRLAKKLGIPCAKQDLIQCKTTIDDSTFVTYACMSLSYLAHGDRKETFENFYDIRKNKGEDTVAFMKRISQQDLLYKLFIFDYLIYNRDRHGANIELLKDSKGNYRVAPLFDNGMSLLFSCHTDEAIAAFDITQDRPVNNYIGYKSVLKNLELIDSPVRLNPLSITDKASFFYGLSDLLTAKHRAAIWNMIEYRYLYCVKGGLIINDKEI